MRLRRSQCSVPQPKTSNPQPRRNLEPNTPRPSRVLLAAWEHLHIPTTVNALIASYFPNGGGPTAPNWPSSDYDTVWTVMLDAQGNLSVDNQTCEGINSATLPATPPQF